MVSVLLGMPCLRGADPPGTRNRLGVILVSSSGGRTANRARVEPFALDICKRMLSAKFFLLWICKAASLFGRR